MTGYHYWGSPLRVGSLQYAKCFAKHGYLVFYLSDWISPFIFFKKRNYELKMEKLKLWLKNGKTDIEGKIFAYNPMTIFYPWNLPIFRSRWIIQNLMNFSFPNLDSLFSQWKWKDTDILWFDNPTYFKLKERIKHKISILRIADNLQGFSSISPKVVEIEQRLISEVDIVFTSSYILLDKLLELRKEGVYYLPNGVNFELFTKKVPIPSDIEDIPPPRILYVGAIADWFDVSLIIYCAQKLQNYSFILVGPVRINELNKLKKLPNVFLLGIRPYTKVPAYMQHSDVGIIPFKLNVPVVKTVNPIKLYEYMATGLPVVSTKWSELYKLRSPALLASGKKDFVELVRKAVHLKGTPQLIEFAKLHSWEAEFKIIDKVIKRKLEG